MNFDSHAINNISHDEFSPATPYDTSMYDVFMTDPRVKNEVKYPQTVWKGEDIKPKFQVPVAPPEPGTTASVQMASPQAKKEGFFGGGGQTYISDDIIIVMFMILILVVCAMIYSSVKETCKMIKILTAINLAKYPEAIKQVPISSITSASV